MSSKSSKTALSYLEGFKTLSPDIFLAFLAPTAIHRFAPASLSPPEPMSPNVFASHLEGLREVLAEFPVFPKEIFENGDKGQVTIWATSEAKFREGCKDDGLTEEEWAYQGEYIFIFTLDESKERIVDIVEFLDSKGTERLRALMTRARKNLQVKRD
ncbi:hypothetical protein N7533_001773 [Penicillium manginii]|jgi:hypothetical protein|uniref:uncharacterized protein n=1 Tax=Penicillium manginii TaxID=203109 RepID=UPI0025466AD5|nr:uncharacterized protein N7533_001773 [Penicillium manginii]KAJ5763092.1 hypothetical protein N7533_001773 [Penicillium manginii]